MTQLTSSVSANELEALCGSPLPQVAANRRGRSYAFSLLWVEGECRSLRDHEACSHTAFADLRFFSWIPTVRGEGGCSDRRWPGAPKSLALSEPDFVATLALPRLPVGSAVDWVVA
jgi:hypothetical protein